MAIYLLSSEVGGLKQTSAVCGQVGSAYRSKEAQYLLQYRDLNSFVTLYTHLSPSGTAVMRFCYRNKNITMEK